MNNISFADELDQSIEALFAGSESKQQLAEPVVRELVAIASELRLLPRPEFKARLRADLMQRASLLATPAVIDGRPRQRPEQAQAERVQVEDNRRRSVPNHERLDILPTLFGAGQGSYPLQRGNFAVSLLAHAAVIALVIASSVLAARPRVEVRHQLVTNITPYLVPAPGLLGGGGSGGTREQLQASKGALPRLSREQITPPLVVVRNNEPRFGTAPTIVAPGVAVPKADELGDPLAAVLAPASNGPGAGSGIGNESGTGVGGGKGPGFGLGCCGGMGGNVYRIGGGVTAPRAIYDPDPEYSDEARKAKYQGVVVLWVVVGTDGLPKDVRVARSLGLGLDEKALDAVRKWRFEPARMDGRPVAVQLNIEVSFRLY